MNTIEAIEKERADLYGANRELRELMSNDHIFFVWDRFLLHPRILAALLKETLESEDENKFDIAKVLSKLLVEKLEDVESGIASVEKFLNEEAMLDFRRDFILRSNNEEAAA